MSSYQDEWGILAASKPLLFTFLFIFTSLLQLSFPSHFNRVLCLATVSLFACAAFLNSTELFPDSYAEEIYLRFVIIYIAYFSFLILRQNVPSTVSDTA